MFGFLLTCKTWDKRYIDNTTDHFRIKWNTYKSGVRKAESGKIENVKQNTLLSHFLQSHYQVFLKI